MRSDISTSRALESLSKSQRGEGGFGHTGVKKTKKGKSK